MVSFLQELAQTLLNRNSGDLSDLVVMFPSLRARAFFNDALSSITDKAIWQPSWSTIDEVMERGSGLKRAERIRLISELYKIYVKYHKSETFDKFYFWGDMLISDFDMIDKYLVDANQLLRNIEDIKEIEADVSYLSERQERILRFWSSIGPSMPLSKQKQIFLEVWRSLPAIYAEYRERLLELGIGYPGLIYRITAERILNKEEIELLDKQYIIAGFNALSKSEEVLFNYIASRGKGAEFYWDYDNYYLKNDAHEAGHFLRHNLSKHPSTCDGITHSNFESGEKFIRTTACASNVLQVKHLHNIISSIPKEELDKRTVIVLTDENLLIPLLHSIPESVGSVNVTMGYPLKTTLAYTFVEALISLQSHSRLKDSSRLFYHADVTNILTHPYVVDMCGTRTSKYCNEIVQNHIVSVEDSLFANDVDLKDIFCCDTDGWEMLSAYIIKSLSLIIEKSTSLNIEQSEYIRIITDEIKRTTLSIKSCDITPLPVEVFISLLRRHLQTLTIPFEGEPIKGVQIMGILETRNIDFKNVIILSMTDANFPGNRTDQPSFIPYGLRFAYDMPTPEEHEAMYAYYFYRLIQRAERVEMLYCSKADDKSTGECSRYIYQLEYESPYKMHKRAVGVDLGLSEARPIVVDKSADIVAKLNKYLTKGSGYTLSPTALFRYIECPLKFYFSSIASIKSPDELDDTIDSLTFGNILHDSIEALYTDLIGIETPHQEIEAMCNRTTVESIVDRMIVKNLQMPKGFGQKDFNGDTLLVRDIIVKYITQGIFRYDLGHSGYTIVGLERDVECEYSISDDRTIFFSGRIDRLDKLDNDKYQIIDYKSNNRSSLEHNGIDKLFNGEPEDRISNIFQTLLYSMMLEISEHKSSVPSLYYASKMVVEGYNPSIVEVKSKTPISCYSDVSEEFETQLSNTLEELFDPTKPFTQVSNAEACTYCPFKKICRR